MLSVLDDDGNDPDPSDRELRLAVRGDEASLRVTRTDGDGTEVDFEFAVTAGSLLRALQAACADQAQILEPGDTAVRPRQDKPAQSGQPWSPEQDRTLRDTWLGAEPTAAASALIRSIAAHQERSPNSIRSRLSKIGCDPDVPGRLLSEQTTYTGGPDDTT